MLTSISKSFKNHHFNSVVQIVATSLLFSLILIFNTTANAGTKYLACNTQQFENILKKFHLISTETLKNNELANRADCLKIDEKYLLIATANIIPTTESQHRIDLYLIDAKNLNILIKYTNPQTASEENGAFASIQFDHVAFSNQPEQFVIGLRSHYYNMGEHSFDLKNLNLFRIQPPNKSNQNASIHWVLKNIHTAYSSSWRPSGCEIGETEEIKSILVLQNTLSHNMQDILLKQSRTYEFADAERKCKTTKENQKSEQILKFNGTQYMINAKKILTSEDLKNDSGFF